MEHMNTNPSMNEQTNAFAQEVSTFLASRRAKFTYTVDLSGTHPTGFGADEPTTYTRAQVREAVIRFMQQPEYADRKDTGDAVTDANGDKYLARQLDATSSHGKVIVRIFVRAMKNVRSRVRVENRANRMATVMNAGTEWVAEGVVDKDGNIRTFPSKRKAVSAWCRHTFGADWHAVDKAARKAQGAEAVSQPRAPAVESAPAPVSTSTPSASVNAKQAKDMAKAMGGSADDCKTKAKAVAFLATKGITL